MNDIDILKLYYKDEQLKSALEKYIKGTPAAYIIGEWEFFGDRYIVNENCLIPRCDTERLVENILVCATDEAYIADLCTGTGCVIISSLKRIKGAKGIAYDISDGALNVARQNANINGVDDRIEFFCQNIFDLSLPDKTFDIIASNPPYISTKDMEKLDEYVKKEPSIALDGGNDGMDFYRHIVSSYKNSLKDGGYFIFEIGYDQEELIKNLAKEHNFNCDVKYDYSNNPRVAILKK